MWFFSADGGGRSQDSSIQGRESEWLLWMVCLSSLVILTMYSCSTSFAPDAVWCWCCKGSSCLSFPCTECVCYVSIYIRWPFFSSFLVCDSRPPRLSLTMKNSMYKDREQVMCDQSWYRKTGVLPWDEEGSVYLWEKNDSIQTNFLQQQHVSAVQLLLRRQESEKEKWMTAIWASHVLMSLYEKVYKCTKHCCWCYRWWCSEVANESQEVLRGDLGDGRTTG